MAKKKKKKKVVQKASRNTQQRQKILEAIVNNSSHPTSEWIFKKLKRKLKSLNLATIYSNLQSLKQDGLIWELDCGKGPNRFNSAAHQHYHFICDNCQTIYDIRIQPMRQLDDKIMQLTGFRILSHRLTFFGLCDTCKQKKKSKIAKI